jgi:hypothetical protein
MPLKTHLFQQWALSFCLRGQEGQRRRQRVASPVQGGVPPIHPPIHPPTLPRKLFSLSDGACYTAFLQEISSFDDVEGPKVLRKITNQVSHTIFQPFFYSLVCIYQKVLDLVHHPIVITLLREVSLWLPCTGG